MDLVRHVGRPFRRLLSLALIVLCLLSFTSCASMPAFTIAAEDVPPLSLHSPADATPKERVASDLAFLTSEFCNGRQIGTVGAAKSAQYLMDEFERIGLSPAYRDGYVQGYTTKQRDQVSGTIRVLQSPSETAVVSFTSSKDLGVAYYSSPGNKTVKGTLTAMPTTDEEWRNLRPGSVVVAKNHQDESSNILNPASQFRASAVLLNTPSAGDGPVFAGATRRSGAMPVCVITENCYNRLQEHLGQPVEIETNAQKGQSVAGFNVVGILGDPNSSPTIVVCAHRDTMGVDSGVYVPIQGGTDNASGTAALLEIARVLEPDREWKWATVFASFDGEEIGLTGSKHFATNYPFSKPNLRLVVNLDCVGVAGCNEIEIYVTPKREPALSAAKAIMERLAGGSIVAVTTEEKCGSDHLSFEAEGFSVLCIHSPGAAYREYLHCPRDTRETVDASVVAALAEAVATGLARGLPQDQ